MKLFEFIPNEIGYPSFFVMSEDIEQAIKKVKEFSKNEKYHSFYDYNKNEYKYKIISYNKDEVVWSENC